MLLQLVFHPHSLLTQALVARALLFSTTINMKFSLISAALLCFSACVSAIPINFEEVDGLVERYDSTFLVDTLCLSASLSFRSYEMDDELAIREWQRIEARTVSNAT